MGAYGQTTSRLGIALCAAVVVLTLVPAGVGRSSAPAAEASPSETAAAAAASPTSPATALGPRHETRSFYVANPSGEAIRNRGCGQGDLIGRLTLFFGAPVPVGGGVGATLWGGDDRTTAEIGELVKEFIRGYVWCRHSPGHQLVVGMGTSTARINDKDDGWLVLHGRHWADVVAQVDEWAQQYHPGIVQVVGAWDPEPSWSWHEKAELWMSGYDGRPGRRGLHVHASADGCPRDTPHNGGCNNGWAQYHLWHLAWEMDSALPMPQIYATSGVNGVQWKLIDEFGTIHHNDGITFPGVMAQASACIQVGGCAGTDNTAGQAHDQLLWHLNTSPITTQAELEHATDMHWHR